MDRAAMCGFNASSLLKLKLTGQSDALIVVFAWTTTFSLIANITLRREPWSSGLLIRSDECLILRQMRRVMSKKSTVIIPEEAWIRMM